MYDQIPANLSKEKLELELHSATQKWETEIHFQGREIEKKVKDSKFDKENFSKIFNEYCSSITEISKSSFMAISIRFSSNVSSTGNDFINLSDAKKVW